MDAQTPVTRPLPKQWLFNNEPRTVTLIGAGGNGSEMLDGLMRLHQALIALDAPGLHVHVIDGDEIEPSNVVRQRFYPHEVGLNKATALVHRANTLMGTDWKDHPCHVTTAEQVREITFKSDLVVTAVDNVTLRQMLINQNDNSFFYTPADSTLWADLGCHRDQGQVVIGMLNGHDLSAALPNVAAHFPELVEAVEQDTGPSCGAAESLSRQDLMINQQVASAATNLLWKALRSGYMPYNGAVIDLSEGLTQPIHFFPNAHDSEAG